MTTRLTLVCHASTAATHARGFPGDEPLDAPGLRKLAAASERFGRPDRAWTSPALRARQTAEELGLEPAPDPALGDWDYGAWTGLPLAEVEARCPDAFAAWLQDPAAAPHGGEALLDVVGRVSAWLDRQAEAPGTVVAVTHAAVVRAALVSAIGAPPASFWRIDVAPLSAAKLSFSHGGWRLSSLRPLAGSGRPGVEA